jgi:glycosyltransferase involved in cell wall biosynthesis
MTAASAQRNVLFLTYLFPPIANSGTRRSLEFANRLPELGWKPLVVSGVPDRDDRDDGLLDDLRPDTTVTRVPLGADVLGQRMGRLLRSQRLGDGLAWRIRALWAVPDYCASWQAGAVAAALHLFRTQGFDVIYASGWPWSSFHAAARISRLTGRPFVLDYRDLWHGTGAEFEQARGIHRFVPSQHRVEDRLLARADAVITTTESFARMLEARRQGRQVHAITNGYAQADFSHFGPPAALAPGRPVHVSYTGIWRPGYGPDDLYAAIALLKQRTPQLAQRLRVTMAGFKPGRAQEQQIDDVVTELGRVSHGRALEIMQNSDALYLPVSGGLMDRAHLPGKVFEYVGSGRRIIASAEEDSEVRRLLAAVGHYRAVLPKDTQGLAQVLQGLMDGEEAGRFPPRSAQAAATYERSAQAAMLARVLAACPPAAAGR